VWQIAAVLLPPRQIPAQNRKRQQSAALQTRGESCLFSAPTVILFHYAETNVGVRSSQRRAKNPSSASRRDTTAHPQARGEDCPGEGFAGARALPRSLLLYRCRGAGHAGADAPVPLALHGQFQGAQGMGHGFLHLQSRKIRTVSVHVGRVAGDTEEALETGAPFLQ